MTISSNVFLPGKPIPSKYTGDGANVSPSLAWDDVPAGTKSFALIVDDPDAPGGTWVHWVVFNIPAAARGLPEAMPMKDHLSDGTRQGLNNLKEAGYDGPNPPSGTHRYFFKLYALDTVFEPMSRYGKLALLKAMDGHILAEAELMGTYSRR